MSAQPFPVQDEQELFGVTALAVTAVDPGGVLRMKLVPRDRIAQAQQSGVGAAPSWHVFCVDNGIAFTPELGVVGDQRLRPDLDAARVLGGGLAWAPANFHEQSGMLSALCSRGRLCEAVRDLASIGVAATVGCEVEFVLTAADGSALGQRPWNSYGVTAVLDQEEFLLRLLDDFRTARLDVEQCHAEYGDSQYEISFAPADPLAAADAAVLARVVISRAARRAGLAASFSPLPFAGGSGNGAHVHVSLHRDGEPLLSGGSGPHGLTAEGAAAIGGIVAGLPEVTGVLAGSVLSGGRLLPDHWAGAFCCWGLENREAAVRLCAVAAGSANIEVKCVDPSANPYLAIATVLGLIADGLRREAPLPAEATTHPADGGYPTLPAEQSTALDALQDSTLARRILGPELLSALLAVRRHELAAFRGQEPSAVADRLRFAWSA
jgi:glutamine synthetase